MFDSEQNDMVDASLKYITAPRDLAAVHSRSAAVIENHCANLTEKAPHEAGEHGAMYISAGLLRAFSIELALKSLLYAETAQQETGHCLKTLFEKLKQPTQQDIKARATKWLRRPFEDVLVEIADVFVVWRYVHEKLDENRSVGFDTDEMKAIAHATFEVLDNRIRTNS